MTIGFGNLFKRPGALGGAPLYHLSRLYDTMEEAKKHTGIIPDAGWIFVTTLEVRIG